MSNERKRIERLSAIFEPPSKDAIGIGDDAAVLADGTVLSVDTSVEGVHFRRHWAPLDVLARRATMAALSDLAAMGAEPRAILSSLILPTSITDEDHLAITRGIDRAARECGALVVGGNLAAGTELSMTTTVVGRSSRPLLRSSAAPGDRLFVTTLPGPAALGLRALLRNDEGPALAPNTLEELARPWLFPRAHWKEGLAIRSFASGCMDLSDGLVADLWKLCDASNLGAELFATPLRGDRDFATACRRIEASPLAMNLDGAEAYSLLFAVPTAFRKTIPGIEIGVLRNDLGIELIDDGKRSSLPRGASFEHFDGAY